MKDNLTIFINRLKKLNIKLELFGNYPWVYIDKIDGKKVKEKHASDWGFVLGYRNEGFVFEDLSKIFEILRKYRKKPKIAFDSYEEAFEEMNRIISTQRKLTEKKACRVYEYKGKWFLTSRPKITEYDNK